MSIVAEAHALVVVSMSLPTSPAYVPKCTSIPRTMMINPTPIVIMYSVHVNLFAWYGPRRKLLSGSPAVPSSSSVLPSVIAPKAVYSSKPNPCPFQTRACLRMLVQLALVWPVPAIQLPARSPQSTVFCKRRLWPRPSLPCPPQALCCKPNHISSISLPLSYLPNPLFTLPIAYQNYSLAQNYFAQVLNFDLMQVTWQVARNMS